MYPVIGQWESTSGTHKKKASGGGGGRSMGGGNNEILLGKIRSHWPSLMTWGRLSCVLLYPSLYNNYQIERKRIYWNHFSQEREKFLEKVQREDPLLDVIFWEIEFYLQYESHDSVSFHSQIVSFDIVIEWNRMGRVDGWFTKELYYPREYY